MEGKGRAVFAARRFRKGEYVVEYHGDLLEMADAKKREAEYAQNPETGCYMYYFQYLCKAYWYTLTHYVNAEEQKCALFPTGENSIETNDAIFHHISECIQTMTA